MVTVSFPGLGIAPFDLNSEIVSFGPFSIRWYGLIITLGIVLAFLYTSYRCKHEGIVFDDLLDIAIFTVIFGVIGARAYYVLTSLDQYHSFKEVIAIWEGGLAIYGAIIGGAITIFAVCRYKKIPFLKMFDATVLGVMIGQILGRWGNFFNGEAYGAQVPEGSFLYFARMGLTSSNTWHDFGTTQMVYVHPTFLYESVWNLIGFLLIHFLYKKKKFDGQVFFMYITWYGFGRMFIEGLRTDSLYVGVFRISQVIGFLCFVAGATVLTVRLMRIRRNTLNATTEYIPTYAKLSHMKPFEGGNTEETDTIENGSSITEKNKENQENEE